MRNGHVACVGRTGTGWSPLVVVSGEAVLAPEGFSTGTSAALTSQPVLAVFFPTRYGV